jgi:hypothetical protein
MFYIYIFNEFDVIFLYIIIFNWFVIFDGSTLFILVFLKDVEIIFFREKRYFNILFSIFFIKKFYYYFYFFI